MNRKMNTKKTYRKIMGLGLASVMAVMTACPGGTMVYGADMETVYTNGSATWSGNIIHANAGAESVDYDVTEKTYNVTICGNAASGGGMDNGGLYVEADATGSIWQVSTLGSNPDLTIRQNAVANIGVVNVTGNPSYVDVQGTLKCNQLRSEFSLDNTGTIECDGEANCGILNNNNGGSFKAGELTVDSVLANQGTIEARTLYVETTGTAENDGVITVDYLRSDNGYGIYNEGTINVTNAYTAGGFTNVGTMNIGTFASTGDITNVSDMTVTAYRGTGSLRNLGTLTCESFTAPSNVENSGGGEIIAETINWAKGTSNSDLDGDDDDSVVKATENLNITGYSTGDVIDGTFEVTEDTVINSDGGTFTIKAGTNTTTITYGIDNMTAADLLLDYADVRLHVTNSKTGQELTGSLPTSYVGVPVILSAEVFEPSGAIQSERDNVSFEIKESGTWKPLTPAATGYYNLPNVDGFVDIRAVAAHKEGVYKTTNDTKTIRMSYLPISEVQTGSIDTLTPTVQEGLDDWYTSLVILTAPAGYKFKLTEAGDTFTTKKVIPENVYYNDDVLVQFRRDSDGALTNSNYSLRGMVPSIYDRRFDLADPILTMTADGTAVDPKDGMRVEGKTVKLTVTDANLYKVTVDGESYGEDVYTEARVGDEAVRVFNFSLEGKPGTQEHTIGIWDESGRGKEIKFSIYGGKETVNPTIEVGESFVGAQPSVAVKGLPEDAGEVTLSYKAEGADAYSSDFPQTPGTYTVKVDVAETDRYQPTTLEKNFSVGYLPAPQELYGVEGTKGKNDYYVSDVYLAAPDGYSIAATAEGEFAKRLLYTDGLDGFVLRREDGARTDRIGFEGNFKIDKEAPVASAAVDQNGKTVQLTNGLKVYADTLTFTITDPHLDTVYVGNDKADVVDGKAVVKLEVGNRRKTFGILATDEAGNVFNYSVSIMAGWMEWRKIPAGAKVPLEAGQSYQLGEGLWTVSGDSTVYVGGGNFYVKKDGDYTFNNAE